MAIVDEKQPAWRRDSGGAPSRIFRCDCFRSRSRPGCGFFVNAGQRNAFDELNIPINYRRLPAGLVIVNHPADFVKIQINGPRTLLSLLDPERLTVRLDLVGTGSGPSFIQNKSDSMFNVPRGTTVTNVSPSEVILDVDRVVQRDIPVHVEVDGKPATDMKWPHPKRSQRP